MGVSISDESSLTLVVHEVETVVQKFENHLPQPTEEHNMETYRHGNLKSHYGMFAKILKHKCPPIILHDATSHSTAVLLITVDRNPDFAKYNGSIS